MYSFEEKEGIIQRFKEGNTIEKLHRKTGIPVDILEIWKKEFELRKDIKRLIANGEIAEAKEEIAKLDPISAGPIRMSYLAKIGYIEKDMAAIIENLEGILEVEPDNLKAMSQLIVLRLADGEKEEESLLERFVEITPKNKNERKIKDYVASKISSLIREAIETEDLDEEIRLLNWQLRINPNNVRAKRSLEVATVEKRKQARMQERVPLSERIHVDVLGKPKQGHEVPSDKPKNRDER